MSKIFGPQIISWINIFKNEILKIHLLMKLLFTFFLKTCLNLIRCSSSIPSYLETWNTTEILGTSFAIKAAWRKTEINKETEW